MQKPPSAQLLNYSEASSKLAKVDQEHLLHWWQQLDSAQQEHLLAQVTSLNLSIFQEQQHLLRAAQVLPCPPFEPFIKYDLAGSIEWKANGLKLMSQGKVGCLIVAGGQGTRLRFNGPKGMFPISIIKQKSLFQLFSEKVRAAGLLAKRKLPLAIMTSSQNDLVTRSFFKENQYFGLDPKQVSFFMQKDLPLLSETGSLFLESKSSIAEGPNGNGSSLSGFVESGIWDDWHVQGVRYLNYVLIDNPLADPFDQELVGYQDLHKAQVTIKCTSRSSPEEKTGILVQRNGRIEVVEYSEFPEHERLALNEDGSMKHLCANLSLFCFDMEFIKELSAQKPLPLHLAHKAVTYLDETGKEIQPERPMAWKFEQFIFDVLPLAEKIRALLYPRNVCYAPLKNFSGENSPSTVKSALQEQDRSIIESITGLPAPLEPFELSQEFYYPTQALLEKWKGKSIRGQSYVDA